MKCVGMKIPASTLARDSSQPCVVIEVGHIDHQGIALPVAYRVSEIRGIHVGAMRPAIGRYKAITPRRAIFYGIKKHGEFRRLDDLPRSARARNSGRFTVELRIVMNFVRS